MMVLVACETSGTVRDAFNNLGHDAWSVDVLPSDNPSNKHIQDDIRNVLGSSWDMLIVCHPPCTRLCNSGVRWLHTPPPNKTKQEMWAELDEGCDLFSTLWNVAHIPMVCVENPIMHKYAKERIKNFEPASQTIQPYHFAQSEDDPDNVSKATCLWLRNLPKLKRTGKLDGKTARHECHSTAPSKMRWKIRSKFFPAVASAMAEQWGSIQQGAKI